MGNSIVIQKVIEKEMKNTRHIRYYERSTKNFVNKNFKYCNAMKNADRYYRNGSLRGNGYRTS